MFRITALLSVVAIMNLTSCNNTQQTADATATDSVTAADVEAYNKDEAEMIDNVDTLEFVDEKNQVIKAFYQIDSLDNSYVSVQLSPNEPFVKYGKIEQHSESGEGEGVYGDSEGKLYWISKEGGGAAELKQGKTVRKLTMK